ncbi:MAG TPA: SIS domain-containing protein [Cyclobacteriaceae bacterium]|nr:SIS domain-containing protein [Cyclobacteriaceae bacterium]
MKYLGFDQAELVKMGAIHTAKEISQQPQLWKKIYEDILRERDQIRGFLENALRVSERIILTGAGTSAFIGLSLRGIFQNKTGIVTEAISTTDLVSHPQNYLSADIPTLVISFARSGNSPESEAAVMLADRASANCSHIIITCNPDGKLARYPAKNKFVFALPEESNDKSLAMTSSYTGMFLAGLLIADIKSLSSLAPTLDTLSRYGEKVISYYAAELKEIAEKKFTRAVFLGSGPLFGTATESHLKLQELTDGKVICKHDSFLGFRHGPKAVINSSTLIVYLFSNDPYVLQYERDLVDSMKKGNQPLYEVGLMESQVNDIKLDHTFCFSENGPALPEEYLAVCSVVPAQILSFYKSLDLGLRPDTPSDSGAITRVVEGVHIYSRKK